MSDSVIDPKFSQQADVGNHQNNSNLNDRTVHRDHSITSTEVTELLTDNELTRTQTQTNARVKSSSVGNSHGMEVEANHVNTSTHLSPKVTEMTGDSQQIDENVKNVYSNAFSSFSSILMQADLTRILNGAEYRSTSEEVHPTQSNENPHLVLESDTLSMVLSDLQQTDMTETVLNSTCYTNLNGEVENRETSQEADLSNQEADPIIQGADIMISQGAESSSMYENTDSVFFEAFSNFSAILKQVDVKFIQNGAHRNGIIKREGATMDKVEKDLLYVRDTANSVSSLHRFVNQELLSASDTNILTSGCISFSLMSLWKECEGMKGRTVGVVTGWIVVIS